MYLLLRLSYICFLWGGGNSIIPPPLGNTYANPDKAKIEYLKKGLKIVSLMLKFVSLKTTSVINFVRVNWLKKKKNLMYFRK